MRKNCKDDKIFCKDMTSFIINYSDKKELKEFLNWRDEMK